MRLFILGVLACAAPIWGKTYDLPVTPQTVVWGHYAAAETPVLTVASGDTVVVHTVITDNPTAMERAGADPKAIPDALRAIQTANLASPRGPGPHILTGPIAIAGAEPGDTLEVRIRAITLDSSFAMNGFHHGSGFLSDDYPYSKTKVIPLDRARMVALFGPGIEVPLHPFFGSMGVAPPADWGRYNSSPPSVIGGNMDDKALVAGSSLFLPVFVEGALFQVGDGHAGQGNGEVDLDAMETSLTGTLEFVLHKGGAPAYPRAETADAYVAMGFDDDLSAATRKALHNMIDFLVTQKAMSRDDAYMLISIAGDVEVTELVDGNKGVHVVMPKSVFLRK